MSKKTKKSSNKWLRLSGAAIQMAAVIGLLTYVGVRVDQYFNFDFPLGTLLGSLSGVSAALYIIIKEAIHLDS